MVQAIAPGGVPSGPARRLRGRAVLVRPVLLGVLLFATAPRLARAEPGLRADYLCKGRFDASAVTAFFFNDSPRAVVLLEGEGATRLPQAVSASGARYSDGAQSFWVKGERASWQQGQAPARHCEPRPR